MEKIDEFFKYYCQTETKIGDDFAKVADAYFRVGIGAKFFNLQNFEVMGVRTT